MIANHEHWLSTARAGGRGTLEPVYPRTTPVRAGVDPIRGVRAFNSIVFGSIGRMERSAERRSLERNKRALTMTLLKRCTADIWTSRTDEADIRLEAEETGRPLLFLNETKGPSVSFSHYEGRTWAAICPSTQAVGIDAACDAEFQGRYPFHRAFGDEELDTAVDTMEGDVPRAAALLWSAKEAAVKAIGCGFRLLDPLEVNVHLSAPEAEDKLDSLPAVVTTTALQRHGMSVPVTLRVHIFREDGIWLSITTARLRPTRRVGAGAR